MSAQHTPGPWKFGKELTARNGEWLVSFDAGSKGRGIAIAETRTGPGSEEANARLIAARRSCRASRNPFFNHEPRKGSVSWASRTPRAHRLRSSPVE